LILKLPPSKRFTLFPWVEPISWQRPRQRNIDPQACSGFNKDNKAST
jgi:hypothetical protein